MIEIFGLKISILQLKFELKKINKNKNKNEKANFGYLQLFSSTTTSMMVTSSKAENLLQIIQPYSLTLLSESKVLPRPSTLTSSLVNCIV